LGRRYSHDQITQALQQFEELIEVEELTPATLLSRSAEVLVQGQVVARFEGRSEYGPRALGQRSIMVDPTFAKIKDVLNARVKFREAFRPFAPVIPVEQVNQVFELQTASPFMLLVPPLQPDYRDQLPGITHVDGTGRVQTVTAEDNPYFYQLCWRLAQLRQGPPVLLNTSFNVAGQPIIETPTEAIQTFLHTDIDYLALEHFWITKRHVKILNYQEHIKTLTDIILPQGLSSEVPAVTDLMAKLDRALFWQETDGCPWTAEELRKLSAQGGRYKETSVLFPDAPLPLRSQLADHIVLLLDPLGRSVLVDLTEKLPPTSYTFDEVKLLLTLLEAPANWQENLRLEWRLTHAELADKLEWATSQLQRYQLQPNRQVAYLPPADAELPLSSASTLAPFAEEDLSVYHSLQNLRKCLQHHSYTEEAITTLLKISSLQALEPTYFYFYDHYRLPHTAMGDLIRLFLLRIALPQARLREIFGDELLRVLINLGILVPRGEEWASEIDLYCAHNLYFATDHRYLGLEGHSLQEDPVMYIGADSLGLTYTAPQVSAERLLDLCCGSGIQGLVASR
jgi:carbamoyltransferase